ncbi:MAG: TetR/AcrR family transcriptional regulator [Clostridia bacterium]|nr:TetR/AcrR family transcriptional regulator [Clostridia bacterium]
MPKTVLQLNLVKQERKQEIIECALKVFCEKGYDGATINDIVKKANCSHGLFYHYFENKKAIFDAVTEMRGNSIVDFLDEVLKDQTGYVQKLQKLTEFTFDNMKKDEIFAYRFYFFVSTIFHKAESGILPPKNKIPPHVRMTAFFEEGVKNGEFTDVYSPDDCARLYNCILKGATLNYILCPKEFKSSFKFPSVQFILDVFRKGDAK